MLNNDPGRIIGNALAIYLFDLLCIYTGRWCANKLLINNSFLLSLAGTLTSMIILSIIGSFGSLFLHIGTPRPFRAYLTLSSPLAVIMVLLGFFLTLIRTAVIERIHKAEIAQQHKEGELNLLLARLSPHFLFNTLNSLYGISIAKQQLVPDLLLKLSDLLRYSIYDVRKPFVPLSDELGYILNYIDFEKLRLGNRVIVNESLASVDGGSVSIAPMLLITFVENAFKHSKRSARKDIEINISLAITDDRVFFGISNTLGNQKEEKDFTPERSGIGLSSTLKRLELLYGRDHSFQQYVENGYYYVNLQLPVK